MAGLLLSPIEAFLSCFVYFLLGLIGLPIFAGFTGGPQSVFKPTFGFIIGFMVMAVIISVLSHKIGLKSYLKTFLILLASEVILYIMGLTYMYFILKSLGTNLDSLYSVLKIGLIPFIPGDILKMIAASMLAPRLKFLIRENH
jgi:biotin transport system substrate-specific component